MVGEATARRRLSRELRTARIAAGLTQSAVAEYLGCRQGKVNKIEDGSVGVDAGDLEKLLAHYGIDGDDELAGRLRALAEEDRQRQRTKLPPVPRAYRQFCDLQLEASEILGWHSEGIPGSLQSDHYVLTQFKEYARTDRDVAELLRMRRARTEVLTIAGAPRFQVVRVPSASWLKMASCDDSTIAASSAWLASERFRSSRI